MFDLCIIWFLFGAVAIGIGVVVILVNAARLSRLRRQQAEADYWNFVAAHPHDAQQRLKESGGQPVSPSDELQAMLDQGYFDAKSEDEPPKPK